MKGELINMCKHQLTIIIPAFNAEKFIERCLDSLVEQEGDYEVIVVNDGSSDNTKKMFSDMCTFYKVPIAFYSDKVSLGHAIGKEFRASLAVLDEGFGKQIQKHLEIGME